MIAKAGESPGVFPYYGPCSAARTSAPTQSLTGPTHRAHALKGTSTSLESVPSAAFPSTICLMLRLISVLVMLCLAVTAFSVDQPRTLLTGPCADAIPGNIPCNISEKDREE